MIARRCVEGSPFSLTRPQPSRSRGPTATAAASRAGVRPAAAGRGERLAGDERARHVAPEPVDLPCKPWQVGRRRQQGRAQQRRPAHRVVRVGGRVVNEAAAGQRRRQPTHGAAEAATVRGRGHRSCNTARHQAREPVGVAMKGGTALRVRQHHAEAEPVHALDCVLELAADRGERRLEQQVRPTAKCERAQLVVLEPRKHAVCHLGATLDLDADARLPQGVVHADHPLRDNGRVVREAVAHVRRRHEHRRPVAGGGARQVERAVEAGRAVVDARQHVTVDVDHERARATVTTERNPRPARRATVAVPRPLGPGARRRGAGRAAASAAWRRRARSGAARHPCRRTH